MGTGNATALFKPVSVSGVFYAFRRYVHGAADSVELNTPYYGLRQIFCNIFNLPGGSELEWSAIRPELQAYLPLLNSITPLSIPENAVTLAMNTEARADMVTGNHFLTLKIFPGKNCSTPNMFPDQHPPHLNHPRRGRPTREQVDPLGVNLNP